MADSYLYNPSETIGKGFSQIQASMGNVFSQIIAQKQNDYNVAEKTFENINALTDKLGEYGQEEITSKTQNLLSNAAKSIIKDGKLDYSQVGKIRNEVGLIKNRKAAIEAGTQMYKEMAQTALATKDDLLNLSTTLDGMRNVILNPNNLSAEDMGRQMQAVYQKNINTTKAASDIFSRIAPASEYATTYTKDGAEYQVAGTKVSGFERNHATGQWQTPPPVQVKDANGNVILNPDGTPKTKTYLEAMTEAFKQQGAPILNAIKAQMGENSVFQTDEQIVNGYLQQYLQNKNTVQKDLQAKSKTQLETEQSNLNISKIQEKNLPTKLALENAATKSSTDYTRARTVGENLDNQITANMVSDSTPLAELGITYTNTTKNVDLGKEIKANVMWNGKKTPFLATGLSYNKANGTYYLEGYPNPKDFEGKLEAGEVGMTAIPIGSGMQSPSYSNVLSSIGSMSNAKTRSLIKNKIAKFKELDLPSGANAATPTAPAKASGVKSQFSSGQMVGNTIYLDRKYQKAEAQIKKDNKAQNVIYIN